MLDAPLGFRAAARPKDELTMSPDALERLARGDIVKEQEGLAPLNGGFAEPGGGVVGDADAEDLDGAVREGGEGDVIFTTGAEIEVPGGDLRR